MVENKETKWINVVWLLIIAGYPFLFCRSGIDFTDFGFMITNYNFIFDAPGSVQYGFGYWLTYVIGGVIFRLADPLGPLFVRIAYSVVIVLSSWLVYRILKPIVHRNILLPIIAFSTLYLTNNLIETWLSYNNLTSLIYLLIALILLGEKGKAHVRYILVGLLAGISIFIRFPNVVILVLPVLYILYEKYDHEKNRLWVITCLMWYTLGVVLAVGLAWLAMNLLGHDIYYLRGLYGLSHAVNETGTSTSATGLMRIFLFGNLKLIVKALIIFVWIYILFKSFNISSIKWIKSIFIFLKMAGTGVALLFVFKLEWSLLNLLLAFLLPLLARLIQLVENRKILYLLSMLLLACSMIIAIRFSPESSSWKLLPLLYAILTYKCVVLFRNGDSSLKYYLVAFALLLLTPFGSSLGFYNSYLGMWMALPLSLWILYEEIRKMSIKWEKNGRIARVSYITFIVFLIATSSLLHDFLHTWREAPKSHLTYEIDAARLDYLLTTSAKAKDTSELLDELKNYISVGDTVFFFNELPILHYMTNTKPFLENPWPQLFSPGFIDDELDQRFAESANWPVIVRKKGGEEWPTIGKIGTVGKIDDYVHDLGYATVWQNERYRILKK